MASDWWSRGDQSALRQRNEARFVEILLDHAVTQADGWLDTAYPGIERGALAHAAGLSRPSVSNLTTRFCDFLDEARPSARGFAQTTLALRPDLGYAFGLDVGARHDRVAMSDAVGELYPVMHERTKPARTPPADSIRWAANQMTQLLETTGMDADSVIGVGVSLAGPVSQTSGLPHPSGLVDPSWRDLNAAEDLQRLLGWYGTYFRTDNDANLGALAQLTWGAARGLRNVLYVKWSDVIGMALIVDGDLHRGQRGFAGEVGHVIVAPDSPKRCLRCGRYGCLEAVSAPGSILRDMGVEEIAERPAEQLVALATRDDDASAALRMAAANIGEVLAGVLNLLEPEAVVIGGRVGGRGFDIVTPPIRSVVDRGAMGFASDIPILRAQEFGRTAVRGAIALALRENLLDYMTAKANDVFRRRPRRQRVEA